MSDLLNLLKSNARLTNAQLADMLGKSEAEVASLISEDTRIEPQKDDAWRKEKTGAWERAVKRSLAWSNGN